MIDRLSPQMTTSERAAFYEWKRLTDAGDPHPAGLGGSLHRRFKKIFAKYEAFGEADALRQILGSTPRDVAFFLSQSQPEEEETPMQGMKDGNLPASPKGRDGTDPSPGLWVPDPEPPGWSETRKRFLETFGRAGALDEEGRRPLMWAFRVLFGGRGELMKQGLTGDILHVYDLSSAYPAQIAELPSMEGGEWVHRKNPTREEIEQSNMLSMFRAETHNFNYFLPFYPLPFRVKSGAIMFPADVRGVWMRDDVVGAFKYFDKFSSLGRLSHGVPGGSKPEIRVTEALFFVPATDEKPFAFIRELFDLRARILKADKNDVRAVILKLAYNSIYGKLAQSVGRKGEPPPYSSPWMAAANRRRDEAEAP
jgi:hypothetical protein